MKKEYVLNKDHENFKDYLCAKYGLKRKGE